MGQLMVLLMVPLTAQWGASPTRTKADVMPPRRSWLDAYDGAADGDSGVNGAAGGAVEGMINGSVNGTAGAAGGSTPPAHRAGDGPTDGRTMWVSATVIQSNCRERLSEMGQLRVLLMVMTMALPMTVPMVATATEQLTEL